MRIPILFAVSGAAVALVAGSGAVAADGRAGVIRNERGAPPVRATGGGSFVHPVGIHDFGLMSAVRMPAASAPSQPPVRGGGGFQPGRPGVAPGEGFIRMHGGGRGEAAPAVPFVPPPRVVPQGPAFTGRAPLARGLGALPETGVGLGTMPTIQQHLQRHGQNLQAWSAGREQAFNRFHQQVAPQLSEFQRNRETMWGQLHGHGGDLIRMARERGADWQGYRRDLWRFRYARADEVRDWARDAYDDLFTYDWWSRHHGRIFPLGGYSPWWWWNACTWDALASWNDFGWGVPIYYDYDANVIVDGDVYVDGQDCGSGVQYAQQAIQLANPPVAAGEPIPPQSANEPDQWQPLGVFALTQQQSGDATMFFQLAVSKSGLIGGAFTSILTGDTAMVTGSIDRATQKVAWHVGSKSGTVYEAGAANLTQDVAPVLVHFGTDVTQTWLLVRLPSPDMPVAPAPLSIAPQ
jgi:hypothetical protein